MTTNGPACPMTACDELCGPRTRVPCHCKPCTCSTCKARAERALHKHRARLEQAPDQPGQHRLFT